REAVAGEEDRREAGELREQGTQRIVHAGEDERLARPEEVRDRIHDRPCHDSRALQKERVPGQEGGARAMAARLPHEFTAPEPAARLERAPSADRVPLRELELPPADGLILLAAHLGEGKFLLDRLDPSVIDEANPTAVNSRLDMYDPANGYRPMAEGPSRYAAGFLAEFRAAQRARCERLDRLALEWCEEAAYFRAKLGAAEPAERP